MKRMPVVFSGHGDPMVALRDDDITRGMAAVGRSIIEEYGRPKAILALSGHWYTRGTYVQKTDEPRQVYDMYGSPLSCNYNGSNTFNGSYGYTLYEGDMTRHGRFTFTNFVQPEGVGRVVMYLTGYRTDSGYRRNIRDDKQIVVEYKTAAFIEQEELAEEEEENEE